jgi:D-alanyl-D-alanine carboxypeptidase
LISSTADLNTFFRALLSGRLLPPWLMKAMTTAVPAPELGPVIRYGLGLMALDLPCGKTIWGHGGDIRGFQTFAFSSRNGLREQALAQSLDPPPEPVLDGVIKFTLTAFCGSSPASPHASEQPLALTP